MRGVAHLPPIADMPLAFLVERIGVACVAVLWRIELQCGLPCKPFRLYPDAPLAHLIGKQAKQGWETGETSLGSPPIPRLAAFASASPLANQKWKGRDPTNQRRYAPRLDINRYVSSELRRQHQRCQFRTLSCQTGWHRRGQVCRRHLRLSITKLSPPCSDEMF